MNRLLREGGFALRVNLLALGLSAAMSLLGATLAGLPGAAFGSVVALYVDRLLTLRRLALRLELPLRHLQNWGGLARLLLAAAAASLSGWLLVRHALPAAPPLPRLLLGGISLAAVYAVLYFIADLPGRRRWVATGDQKG